MKGELQGYKVDIPDPPDVEGWEAVEYRIFHSGDYVAHGGVVDLTAHDGIYPVWIMRRKPRRRIVFEECGDQLSTICGSSYISYFMRKDGVVDHYWPDCQRPIDFQCWLRRTDEEVGE